MKFNYKALTDAGIETAGEIEAPTLDEARTILLRRGYIPRRLAPGRKLSGAGVWEDLRTRLTRVSFQELILFTKQFRSLFRAGVPITEVFRTLEHQTENRKLKRIVIRMQEDVKEGESLYKVFSRHPEVFSGLYCSMISAGEASGSLSAVLDRLIYLLEHEQKVKTDIRTALQYPIIVLVALAVAFFILLTFVIPKFVTIFQNAGIELPMPTVVALQLYELIIGYWHVSLGAFVAAALAAGWYVRTERGRILWHHLLLRIPVIGAVLQKAAMSRFASIFSILQASGITVLGSMDILSRTIGNAAVSREFDKVRDQLKEGRGISGPLDKARYFPPMVVDMVAVGEESGNLDEMLQEVSKHYDDEVAYSISQLTTNLGPFLIVCLAAVVGFFALAVFLPMWDLTKMVR